MVGGKASYRMEKLDYFQRAIVRYFTCVSCITWHKHEVVSHKTTVKGRMPTQNYLTASIVPRVSDVFFFKKATDILSKKMSSNFAYIFCHQV